MGLIYRGISGGVPVIYQSESTPVGVTDPVMLAHRGAILWGVDLTKHASGILAAGSLGGGLAYSCATGAARTGQTGTSTVVSAPAADQPIIGRLLDADALGLWCEGGRTNRHINSREWIIVPAAGANVGSAGVVVLTPGDENGPDGAVLTADLTSQIAGGNIYYTNAAEIPIGQSCSIVQWVKRKAGAGAGRCNIVLRNGTTTAGAGTNTMLSEAWQRITLSVPVTGEQYYWVPISGGNESAVGGDTANAHAYESDLKQTEWNLFPTNAIISGAAATARAGTRLYHPSLAASLSGAGRLALEIALAPLGASTEYATDGAYMYLAYADANNHVRIDTATRRLEVTVGGALWSPAGVLAWARNDTVRFFVSLGGNVVNSWAKYKVNAGAVVDLGNSGAPQAVIAPGALALDIGCLTTTLVFSGKYTEVVCWRPDLCPAWAV